MIKRIKIFCLLFISSTGFSHSDSSRFEFSFGFGTDFFGNKASAQRYALDLYVYQRRVAFDAQLNLRYALNSKLGISLQPELKSFWFPQRRYLNEILDRFPDHYYYSDFDNDETSSTVNSFWTNALFVNFDYCIRYRKMEFLPTIGLGAGKWRHRDFDFILREKTKNEYVKYQVLSDFNYQMRYRLGVNLRHDSYPNAQLNLSYSVGRTDFNYTVTNTPASGEIVNEFVDFKNLMSLFNLTFCIRFNE